MKKWIKLLRAYDGHAVNEICEVEEAIARALIAGGVAEEATQQATEVLGMVGGAELQAQMRALTSTITEEFRAGAEAIRAARPNLGRVDPGESEDDKKFPTGGFRSLAHFATNVRRGSGSNPFTDAQRALAEWSDLANRVQAGNIARGIPTGLNEGSDADGGALVPVEFANRIWERTRVQENLANRVDFMPISGSAMTLPGDAETTRKDGGRRGGVQAFWEGEADQYLKSKPSFRTVNLKLKKLTALVYVTNELLDDSGGALDSYLSRVVPEEFIFKLNDGLTNGNGAGMPVGMLNAACKVIVGKETNQPVKTLTAMNIINMWARLYAPCRGNAAWFINQDIEPQLATMTLATGPNSGQLVYMPPTGLSSSPYATLQGRPVIPIEQCQTLGTEGDIILADLSQYVGIRKSSGIQQAVSIHLRFDYDETVFKWTMRVDAQPAWNAPLQPFKGSNSQSPIVTLQTRA